MPPRARTTSLRALGLLTLGLLTLAGCKNEPKSPFAEMARAATKDQELSSAIPILSVANLKRSQAYFRDVLGFCVEWEHGDPPDFGSVGRAGARFFLCEKCAGEKAWTMVFVKDVDKLYEEIARKGAKISRPPTDEPWNLREMQVLDLDGNVIRFASHHRR